MRMSKQMAGGAINRIFKDPRKNGLLQYIAEKHFLTTDSVAMIYNQITIVVSNHNRMLKEQLLKSQSSCNLEVRRSEKQYLRQDSQKKRVLRDLALGINISEITLTHFCWLVSSQQSLQACY